MFGSKTKRECAFLRYCTVHRPCLSVAAVTICYSDQIIKQHFRESSEAGEWECQDLTSVLLSLPKILDLPETLGPVGFNCAVAIINQARSVEYLVVAMKGLGIGIYSEPAYDGSSFIAAGFTNFIIRDFESTVSDSCQN